MYKTNLTIRKTAKDKGIHFWQIADRLGIHDTEFSKRMRYELSQEEQDQVLNIIAELTDQKH